MSLSLSPTLELLAALERPPIILGQGEQRLISVPSLLRYSIGGPEARALRIPPSLSKETGDSKENLLVKGISQGKTDLWVWKTDGSSEHRVIYVQKLKPNETHIPLEKAIQQLNETEIIYTGRGVILRGKVRSIKELTLLAAVGREFPKEVHDETEACEELLEQAQRQIQGWIQKSPQLSHLRLEKIGLDLWLRGTLERRSDLPSIQRQAQLFYPKIQIEIESLADYSPTVYFRVFLIELRKSEFQTLGLSWPGATAGAFHVTTGLIQDLIQMDLTLQHLESNGSAKILSNPELVVRAPGEAELFAGGELPIQTQSRFYSNVTWKNYGLTLRLKVAQAVRDRVRLDIFTEVSHLDAQGGEDKIPGIQANRMKTQVDARFGTPLLLSGLLQQKVREDARGIPFLRGIPVLGLLFGSKDYLNEKSELVAILYPYASPPSNPLKKFQNLLPKGPIPPPRTWISPSEEKALRESPDFPWNALQ